MTSLDTQETQNPTHSMDPSPPALDFPYPLWYTISVNQVRHIQTKRAPLGEADATG
jgi:hypothetical protein